MSPSSRSLAPVSVLVAALLAAACSGGHRDRAGGAAARSDGLGSESDDVAARLDSLRARFSGAERPVLPAAHGRFRVQDGSIRADRPNPSSLGVTLALDRSSFSLLDPKSGLAVEVSSTSAETRRPAQAAGYLFYGARAAESPQVFVRVVASGVEDWSVVEASREAQLVFSIDLDASVAGLRLVGHTLELLDSAGAPRIRMLPPYLVDARGMAFDLEPEVTGCRVSTNAAPPWGRPVLAPVSRHCSIALSWRGRDVAYPVAVDPEWTVTGLMSGSRSGHTLTRVNDGRVIAIGGKGLTSTEWYDPTTGTWAAGPSLAQKREFHTATLLADGRVLVIGGTDGLTTVFASSELWDPANPSVFTAGPTLCSARELHTATALPSGDVLVVGGRATALAGPSLGNGELVSPNTPASPACQSPLFGAFGPRSRHTATLLGNGLVLVVGGMTKPKFLPAGCDPSTDNTSTAATSVLYDPSGGTSGSVNPINGGGVDRAAHTAIELPGGKVLIAAGFRQDFDALSCGSTWSTLADALLYDPVANSFQSAASLSGARSRHVVALYQGKALVAGGAICGQGLANCTSIDSAELYDPSANSWTKLDAMSQTRADFAAAPLSDGSVLVAGGDPAGKTAEIFALGKLGSICAKASECDSGFCADGDCCDAACTGSCQACTQALKGAGNDGTCDFISSGMDSGGDCKATGVCGQTGNCDGSGGCEVVAPGTACGATVCQGNAQAGAACDNAQSCAPNTLVDCAPYLCQNGACSNSCAADSDCATGAYCAQNQCVTQKSKGDSCAANDECATGFCVDGYCCNTACTDQCAACSVTGAEGTCVPISGAPVGSVRQQCAPAGADPCSAALCDGIAVDHCAGHVGSSVSCRQASCADGEAVQPATCDGSGACPAETTKSCAPYACGATACKTACATDSDCAQGNSCAGGKCQSAAQCVGERSLKSPSGQIVDCSPYLCSNGACNPSCSATADCSTGYVCDQNHTCVHASSAAQGTNDSSGGCGCRAPRRAPGRVWPLLLAFAALGLSRMRRRRA